MPRIPPKPPIPPITLEPPEPPIPLEPPIPKTEEGPSKPSGSGRREGGKKEGQKTSWVQPQKREGQKTPWSQPQLREGHVPGKSLARKPPQENERESKVTRQKKALTHRGEEQWRLRKKAEAPSPVEGWEEGPWRMGE